MNNEVNMQYAEDEIDLKELILVLWNRKVLIISVTIIFALLAGIVSKFFITPVYNTKLNVIVSMPEQYKTKYGDYKLPLTTNEQYMNLIFSNDVLVNTIAELELSDITVDRLRESIAIRNLAQNGQNGNTFEITVSASNSSDSLKLAKVLYNNYVDFLDFMTKEQVVNHFYNHFTVELTTLEDSLVQEEQLLKSNEELLSHIKMELTTSQSGMEIVGQLGGSSAYAIPVNTVNPNYIKVETDIIENKQTINILSNSIDKNKKYIESLSIEKKAIAKHYETGKVGTLNIELVSIIESNIYMPSQLVESLTKASPSNFLNTAIGGVLGGMLSVMIVLFQWYWNKEK